MEELKNNLINLVNQSQLSPEAIYFVVKDFYRDVYDSYEHLKLQEKARAVNNTTPDISETEE